MLDKTEIIKRVAFDVSKFEHRKAVADFNSKGKWNIHFEVPRDCNNLPYKLMVETLNYYVGAEQLYRDSADDEC